VLVLRLRLRMALLVLVLVLRAAVQNTYKFSFDTPSLIEVWYSEAETISYRELYNNRSVCTPFVKGNRNVQRCQRHVQLWVGGYRNP
jgi:hypothetical protein